jgi:hypothetical protein
MSGVQGAVAANSHVLDIAESHPRVTQAMQELMATIMEDCARIHASKNFVDTFTRRSAHGLPDLTPGEEKTERCEAKQYFLQMFRQQEEAYKNILTTALKEDAQKMQRRFVMDLEEPTEVAQGSAIAMLWHVAKTFAEADTKKYAEGRDDTEEHLNQYRDRKENWYFTKFFPYVQTASRNSVQVRRGTTGMQEDPAQVVSAIKGALARCKTKLGAQDYATLLLEVDSFVFAETVKVVHPERRKRPRDGSTD